MPIRGTVSLLTKTQPERSRSPVGQARLLGIPRNLHHCLLSRGQRQMPRSAGATLWFSPAAVWIIPTNRALGLRERLGSIPLLIDDVSRDKFTSHVPDLVRTDQEMSATYAPIMLTTSFSVASRLSRVRF